MAESVNDLPRTRSQDDVRRFFSAFAVQWDSLYGGRRSAFWRVLDHAFRRDIYERYQLTFEQLGSDLSGRSILDVGCGSGIYCFEAARRGASRVVGVDIADDMVALARSRRAEESARDICQFVVSDFPPRRDLTELSSPFDYAIVMGVMDYVTDAESFLSALRPLVGGLAILSFPGRHWLRNSIRQNRYRMLGRCDVHNYDEAPIRQACAKAGFQHVDVNRLDHSGVCYIVTARP